MKLAGFGLLMSGWILAVLALVLLSSPGQRAAFVVAALVVEGIGMGLAMRGHRGSAGDE
jgi:hypothetical protein